MYALSVYADLYGLAPVGTYKVQCNFGEMAYSYERDRDNWWKYRLQGDCPPWMYYVKFENMTESEARAMVEEAQPDEPKLFGEE